MTLQLRSVCAGLHRHAAVSPLIQGKCLEHDRVWIFASLVKNVLKLRHTCKISNNGDGIRMRSLQRY